MKAILTPENIYTLTVGVTMFPNMRQTGEWEGFIKLDDGRGNIAILTNQEGPFSTAFSAVWTGRQEMNIIMATGAILDAAVAGSSVNTV